MHRLQSASQFFSTSENIRYEEAIISLERTISFVTSVNLKTLNHSVTSVKLKNAGMASGNVVMKKQYTLL